MPVSDRLPQDLIDFLNRLAEYEGKTRQNVHADIIRMFKDAIGPIPEPRPSFLKGPWPGNPNLSRPKSK